MEVGFTSILPLSTSKETFKMLKIAKKTPKPPLNVGNNFRAV